MKYVMKLYNYRQLTIIATVFAFVLIVDLIYGDRNYSPTWQLTNIWFSELVAFIVTAIILSIVSIKNKALLKNLPWLFAGIGALSIGVYIYYSNAYVRDNPPDQYDNSIGRIYYVEHSTLPYTSPFHNPDNDYLLQSDLPDFLLMQLFVIVPWLGGYIMYRLFSNKDAKNVTGESDK